MAPGVSLSNKHAGDSSSAAGPGTALRITMSHYFIMRSSGAQRV